MTASASSDFAALVQEFFLERLISQCNASACTVASYRDTFRLLLAYAEQRLHKPPTRMTFADLDTELVLGFLNHIEKERGNSPRTRNLRLTAVRSFAKYACCRDPTVLPTAQRLLAIPTKRFDQTMVGYLSREEVEAILAAPVAHTWSGRRDRVMFATLYNTGARVSEIVAARLKDLMLDGSPFIRLHGKGRKERTVPLWRTTAQALRNWMTEVPGVPEQPIFPNRSRHAMSRSGVQDRLDVATRFAAKKCPTLRDRHISPHTVRHTTAMHLLQAGVDITVIALWLGHESPATTHLYVEANLQMKEQALEKLQPPDTHAGRYKPNDRLLAFLEGL